jgi:hypothetical protein
MQDEQDDDAIMQMFERATAKVERLAENSPTEHATFAEFVQEVAGDDVTAQAQLVDQLLDQGGDR